MLAPKITLKQAVEYEMLTSWWVGYCGTEWLQRFASKYYIWKCRRKMKVYDRMFRVTSGFTQVEIDGRWSIVDPSRTKVNK